jgi:hypothetical protein
MRIRVLLAALTVSATALAQTSLPLPATGNVTLPLEDYNRLVELASKPPKPSDTPPFPYIVKNAQMNLQVAGESVTGTIALEGEVFAKGDRKVPLVSGMVVLDAQQRGRELPIDAGAAVLSGPAEFAVTVEAGLPLTIEADRASFTLPVPAAGTVRLTLSVPGDQTQVTLSPGLITSRASQDGRTTIEATLQPGKPALIWWAARLSAPSPPVAPKEVRFVSDVKTLISVNQAELAVAALAEITVVEGEPSQFEIHPPEGYELTGVTGPTLLSSEVQPKAIRLIVRTPAAQNHQFLISLAIANTATKAEVPLVTFVGAQRETGEVLVEGEGAMELAAAEHGGLRRMDLKETSPTLRSLARAPLHAAFRYQKKPAEIPALALEWVRFPDSSVLSAVAQRAEVTTLVTSEGRSLTEVKLTLKNQSQPFLKVALPAGASILSCEVAGEKVKPVTGADGSRVPLLRSGFRPADAYVVSFVFVHAGAPFEKKGGAELSLPKMDVPIGLVEWEVFLPQRYKVADFGGDALSARLLPAAVENGPEGQPFDYSRMEIFAKLQTPPVNVDPLRPGQVGGLIADPSGAAIARAEVTVLHLGTGVTLQAFTDTSGRWMIANVPSGRLRIMASANGFRAIAREIDHDAGRGSWFSLALQVGSVSETVEVIASVPRLETSNAATALVINGNSQLQQVERASRQNAAPKDSEASLNVADLQRRVVGVLPIGMSVPHTGTAYHFARPLVVDEETRLTFTYKSK